MAKQPDKTLGTDTLDFRDKLWQSADELRGTVDAAEYKHVVLGLIFLKYVADSFLAYRAELDRRSRDENDQEGFYCEAEEDRRALLETREEYEAAGVFWVPEEARWERIKARAAQADLGKQIDDAMYAIEEANPKRLKGVLPRNYAGRGIPSERMRRLVELISDIDLHKTGANKQDVLGRVYEFFLGKFAAAEGKLGGEFYTPRGIVKLLVEMIEPFQGRVYDPCCGSGGMFVQSEEFVEHHAGVLHVDPREARRNIAIYGQESNQTTWKLARMNLAIRRIEANLGPRAADTFTDNLHPDLRADYILANPPFNVSSWHGNLLKKDPRWQFGVPPEGNANYAWIQHFLYHLAPSNNRGGGVAGFVMANGSLSSNTSGEGAIRQKIIQADLVDCIVALPGQLFLTTGIPVCLWFLRRGKLEHCRNQTLFIDARKLGTLQTRTLRVLSDAEIAKVADTYHAWRQTESARAKGLVYADVAGFCKAASLEHIEQHGFVLTPGRYVGLQDELDEDERPFAERLAALTEELREQMEQSTALQQLVLKRLGGVSVRE